jgi:hypothetical protein
MILAPIAVRFLAENLDLLGSMIWILEGYLLLDAPAFLQVGGSFGIHVLTLKSMDDGVSFCTIGSWPRFTSCFC